jgi:type II secretory pathway component GspD/PulD (secretin)
MLNSGCRLFAFTALALLAGSACAQPAPSGVACPDTKPVGAVYRTFYLSQNTTPNHFIQVQTILRNMLQGARIDGVSMQNAIGICGTPAELDLAQKIVSDMDHPEAGETSWRLTYTFTHAGSSHTAAFTVGSGENGTLKQGSRVPIITGTSNGSDQYQYIDIGLDISAHVEAGGETLRLTTTVERSEMPELKPASSTGDPVIGATELKTTAIVTPGKPQVLGSLTLPDGGQEQVSVTAEPVP